MKLRTKASLLFCFLTLASASAQNSDIRLVNGKAVDLAPVQEWFTTHKGQRPMPHWKQIRVHEIKGIAGGYNQCTVIAESGARQDILLANIPPSVGAFFRSIAQKQATVARLRSALQSAL